MTLLWSPGVTARSSTRRSSSGAIGASSIDSVSSYTALRAIATQRDRILLNSRPYPDAHGARSRVLARYGHDRARRYALRRDVELAKAMGFNGVRKHQKLEDPRYLYWADVLGLLVWVEMPSAYRFTKHSVGRADPRVVGGNRTGLQSSLHRRLGPFNESWGVPNLPDNPAERHYVQALYHLTRTLDPTRPVIGNDGWESVATDMIGIHDYDPNPDRLARRYHAEEAWPRAVRRERPGGRLLVVGEDAHTELPVVLSEFGGIAFSETPAAWGYSRAATAVTLQTMYPKLMTSLHSRRSLQRLLLHAVCRYLSGGEWAPVCRSASEIPARGDRCRHQRCDPASKRSVTLAGRPGPAR